MATQDAIKIVTNDNSASEAADLIMYKNVLTQAYQLGAKIRARMRRNFDDAGGAETIDWAQVEARWGIPPIEGDSIGPNARGADVFTMIDGSVGAMEGTFQTTAAKDFMERIG